MKKERFSVKQIVRVLKQAEVGVPVAELIRKEYQGSGYGH
jgi:putative transposase